MNDSPELGEWVEQATRADICFQSRERRWTSTMSFDLAFWYVPDEIDASRAAEIYEGIMEEAEGIVPDSPAVDRFREDVVAVFPNLTYEDSEEEISASPWASELYYGPGFLVATISWSRHGEVSEILNGLANRHGLTCYDPQVGIVVSPKRQSS
jgi:hypothetical protein